MVHSLKNIALLFCLAVSGVSASSERKPDDSVAAEKVGIHGGGSSSGYHCESCRQTWCDLDLCFDDHAGPSAVVNAAFGGIVNSFKDGGALVGWQRTEPAQWCNNGRRKGRGTYKVWRVPCATPQEHFNVNYNGPQGSVVSRCTDHNEVRVKTC